MTLSKFSRQDILSILILRMQECSLFRNYVVVEQDSLDLKSPTISTQYNITLENKESDRWLYFRLEDFGKKQRIYIWINKLKNLSSSNLDLEMYYSRSISKSEIKRMTSINVKILNELTEKLKFLLDFLQVEADQEVKEIISGKKWIDHPFEWTPYK